MATYELRHTVKLLKEFGADFSQHLYVPEIDPVTGTPHHERGDHNHVLNFEAFVFQHQSVVDAEILLSYHVAKFFREKGYEKEYQYVNGIAQWHEASD